MIDSHSPRRTTRSTSTKAWTAGSVPNWLQTLCIQDRAGGMAGHFAPCIAFTDMTTVQQLAGAVAHFASRIARFVADHHELAGTRPCRRRRPRHSRRLKAPAARSRIPAPRVLQFTRDVPSAASDTALVGTAVTAPLVVSIGIVRRTENPPAARAWSRPDPEIEVVAVHAARARCRHRLDDAGRLDPKRLLVDRNFHPGLY